MLRILKKVIHEGDCWIWTGCINSDGYPKLARNKDCNTKGHRYIYEQTHGEIPEGYVVRHSCDNKKCLNPDHLSIGTPAQNMEDRRGRGRTSNHISDEINDKITELRSQGLTKSVVARVVGCSPAHIRKLENKLYKYLNG